MIKDEVLKKLSQDWDVARFLSVSPSVEIRESTLEIRDTLEPMVQELLEKSPRQLVNVRSFCRDTENIKTEFVLGLETVDDVVRQVEKNCEAGLFSIVNENIDPSDGGISGVMHGDIMEFITNGTPRDVEKGERVILLGKALGIKMLEMYYQVDLRKLEKLPVGSRIEFTITRDKRLLVWEVKKLPNRGMAQKKIRLNAESFFVETVREKVFGLLFVSALRLNVVESKIINSIGEEVSFGKEVKTDGDTIYRSAPSRFSPGEFGNVIEKSRENVYDRIRVLEERDKITYLAQKKIDTKFVGGVISRKGKRLIELSKGDGQDFMLGKVEPIDYQEFIKEDENFIDSQIDYICSRIDDFITNDYKLELIIGKNGTVYIAQFNVIESVKEENPSSVEEVNSENTLVVDVEEETPLSLSTRLEYLEARGKDIQLVVFKGNIGHTSHFCDVVIGRGIKYLIETGG